MTAPQIVPPLSDEEIEEGSACNQEGCSGQFKPAEVVGCSCHISPPCVACTSAGYTCDTCLHDTAPPRDHDYSERPAKATDRSNDWTSTHTANPFNSTPFTKCCGVAAINTDRCPSCKARITHHDDGLAERRRWANGGCLMCGKQRGDISIAGNCCC